MDQNSVNRRDAIRALATAGLGAAAMPLWADTLTALARAQAAHGHPAAAAAAPQAAWTPQVFTPRQNETVATLCELIIPETDTPGARAALVNRFIDSVLQAAAPGDRASFLNGLAWLDARSTALFGTDVLGATAAQQTTLLTRLSSAAERAQEEKAGAEFFDALKAMTITGYYTTAIGLRQELGDDGQLVLAEFKGCDHREHQ